MNAAKFSVSLNVASLEASLAFYHALGFQAVDGGHMSRNFPDTDKGRWRILRLDSAFIGLFEGMIDRNMLTVHTNDLREAKTTLHRKGVISDEQMESPTCVLRDPDGNPVLIEQA